jgi:hypothetical protein
VWPVVAIVTLAVVAAGVLVALGGTPTRQPASVADALRAGLALRTVPPGVDKALLAAPNDRPITYGGPACHVPTAATTSGPCGYGDPRGTRTVVLFGDSHAAQWFPGLQQVALRRHWKLINLTKAACPAASVTVYNPALGRRYTECDRWRAYALRRIAALKPDGIVMSSARRYHATASVADSAGFDRAWGDGTATTIRALRATGARVVLVADSPSTVESPAKCLRKHRTDIRACALPVRQAVRAPQQLRLERAAATAAGATLIDPTAWVCTSRCPQIVARIPVYRDGHHLTGTYTRWLAGVLSPALAKVVEAP